MEITNTQIRKLGERLKRGNSTEADLRLLDDYRQSFIASYMEVLHILRDQLGLRVTGRKAKSKLSIIAKLQRERTRLDRMQDIAGCRVIVQNLVAQENALQLIQQAFGEVKVDDRRNRPSHGYQAVHVIVKTPGKQIEIQIRTELQHWWAELSEKQSDLHGIAVKYGEGPKEISESLLQLSQLVSQIESLERSSTDATTAGQDALSAGGIERVRRNIVSALKRHVASLQSRSN